MTELPSEIYARIQILSKEGDALADVGKSKEAVAKYEQALALLPSPKDDWEATKYIEPAGRRQPVNTIIRV